MQRRTLIIAWWLLNGLLPSWLQAEESVYVWKTKGINTYSDIPPTKGYYHNELESQNTVKNHQQDKISCDLAQKNLSLAVSIEGTTDKTALIESYQKEVDKYCH